MPRSFDRTLAIVVRDSGLPRLSSHGLRHSAATHMVQSSADLGELREEGVFELLARSLDFGLPAPRRLEGASAASGG